MHCLAARSIGENPKPLFAPPRPPAAAACSVAKRGLDMPRRIGETEVQICIGRQVKLLTKLGPNLTRYFREARCIPQVLMTLQPGQKREWLGSTCIACPITRCAV